jgi:hypothetical protein
MYETLRKILRDKIPIRDREKGRAEKIRVRKEVKFFKERNEQEARGILATGGISASAFLNAYSHWGKDFSAGSEVGLPLSPENVVLTGEQWYGINTSMEAASLLMLVFFAEQFGVSRGYSKMTRQLEMMKTNILKDEKTLKEYLEELDSINLKSRLKPKIGTIGKVSLGTYLGSTITNGVLYGLSKLGKITLSHYGFGWNWIYHFIMLPCFGGIGAWRMYAGFKKGEQIRLDEEKVYMLKIYEELNETEVDQPLEDIVVDKIKATT